MEWLIAVVVVAILGVAAVAAAGGLGAMAGQPVFDTFQQDLPADRPLRAGDLQSLRFGMTFRGYSMRQVDEVLDRLTRELAERDAVDGCLEVSRGPEPSLEVPATGEHE